MGKEIANTLNRKCLWLVDVNRPVRKCIKYEKKGGYLIVNCEILLQDDIYALRKFDGIVYDEIHRIKNEVGKTFKKHC